MDTRTRIVYQSVLGVALGMIIGVGLCAIIGYVQYREVSYCAPEFVDYIGDPAKALVIEALICGIMGGIDWGSATVYYLESWSVLRATITHFIVVMVVYYPIAFYLRWLSPSEMTDNMTVFACMCVAYVMIWLSNYLSSRARVREINRDLEEIKNTHPF
ncbi:MAG: DUF3021 domain-containing protein [Lachnospiraceae bacterium]|nr:DUF3021 domain-containing protein [Lachnospiraceae bacterium]